MKLALNETLRNRINKMITEDYGINLELDNTVSSVAKSIILNLKGKQFIKREDNIYVKEHTETVIINNQTVKVYVTNYWFKTTKEKNNFLKTHIIYNGYIFENKWLLISLFSIGNNGFDEEEFYDTLYHEFEHCFQTTKMGNDFGNTSIYAIAKSNLFSKDKIKKSLAQIIYASTQNEQDAMINGLYGSLKNCNFADLDNKIKQSEAYIWYKNLFSAYLLIKGIDEENLNFYLKQYNKTKKWFLTIVKKVIKSFERKLSRVVFKLKYKNLKEGKFRPYIFAENNMVEGQLFWLN